MRYPLAHVTYGQEEIDAVVQTLEQGRTTSGPRVREFEALFAAYVGRKHAIMVNSGSSADLLIAFGLGPATPGDEIIVPSVTWPTQIWSCLMAGYTVRLVDVHPTTLQFNNDDIEANLNARTVALFPAHILGNVGDMDALSELAQARHLPILEDCCEALGSTWRGQQVGTYGTTAAYSFFFSHLLSTMEGGMVVTDDDAHLYRLWRSHGWQPKTDYHFWFTTWGLNIRPTELQGAFGGVQMGRIDEFLAARLRNYSRLAADTTDAWPDSLGGVLVLPGCAPAWHGFPVMVRAEAAFNRDALCRYLDARDIETRPIVAGNLTRQPAILNDSRVIHGDLPGADVIHSNGFYIGLSSFDDAAGCAYVAEVLNDFMHMQ